jgi:hypothetical protein
MALLVLGFFLFTSRGVNVLRINYGFLIMVYSISYYFIKEQSGAYLGLYYFANMAVTLLASRDLVYL